MNQLMMMYNNQLNNTDSKLHKKITLEEKSKIPNFIILPRAFRKKIHLLLRSPTLEMYDVAQKFVRESLSRDFTRFKDTLEFEQLSKMLHDRAVSSMTTSVERPVEPFDPKTVQSFVLKVKGSKRSKDIKFNKKQTIFTIGRDKSNNLVIEDSRVSRSHARVEYTPTQCEYIDLGSSCGSKLNGKPVLRAKLRPGDVIELGQSTLIFQVKPKKRFALFG